MYKSIYPCFCQQGISLRWEAPKAATPSCPLKGYIVRLKTDFDKRPKRWTVDADRHALKLYSLLEGTTYHVRVLAVLCNGKMAHSNWVTVQTRKRPDRPANDVTQITGSALGLSSIQSHSHTRTQTHTHAFKHSRAFKHSHAHQHAHTRFIQF